MTKAIAFIRKECNIFGNKDLVIITSRKNLVQDQINTDNSQAPKKLPFEKQREVTQKVEKIIANRLFQRRSYGNAGRIPNES